MLAQVPWRTGYISKDLDMVLWNVCSMHMGTPSFTLTQVCFIFGSTGYEWQVLLSKGLNHLGCVSAWKSGVLLLLSYFSHQLLQVLTFSMTQSICSLYNQCAQTFFKMVSHSIKVRCPRSVWISVDVLCLRARKQFYKGWPSNIL